jgi:hypothetical protein
MIKNANPKSLLELWKKATPLKEAWYQFGPKNLREEYDNPRISQPTELTGGLLMLEKQLNDGPKKEAIIGGFQSLNALQQKIKIRSDLKKDMQDILLEKLASDKFLAIGFERHDFPAPEPTLVPPYLLDETFINWADATLKGFGVEYISVRAIRNPGKAQLNRASADKPLSAKIGRPSASIDIRTAIEELIKSDPDLHGKSKKELHRLVLNIMDKMFPGKYHENQKRSYETVRKALKDRGFN